MMQCYMRQHFADRYMNIQVERTYDEEIHKRINTYFVKGLVCRWNVQKMRPESSECVRKTTGFFTHSWRIKMSLEGYFEQHAQEVWERNWINPEMQTTLLNTCPPKNDCDDSECTSRTTQRK